MDSVSMAGLLLALAVGLCVLGAGYGIALLRSQAKLPSDLAIALEVGRTRTTAVGSVIDRLGMRYAPAVLRMMGPARVARVRAKIDHAGNPGGLTVDRYAARRAVYGALGLIAFAVFTLKGSFVFGLVFIAFGYWFADLGIWLSIRQRRDEIDKTLPDFLDVLAVVVGAGLSFRRALERVSSMYAGPWSDEIRITLRQMEMGMSRRQAFDELRRRNESEQVGQFVTALQQGEELGSPIAETLMQIAQDMRRTDAQNARRRAARAVPKATGVVTTFMIPATMILLMAGLLLGTRVDAGLLFGD